MNDDRKPSSPPVRRESAREDDTLRRFDPVAHAGRALGATLRDPRSTPGECGTLAARGLLALLAAIEHR